MNLLSTILEFIYRFGDNVFQIKEKLMIPRFHLLSILFFSLISSINAGSSLPAPDGKEANMNKPVQVYILMGQSNMLGFGKTKSLKEIAPEKYPYLIDKNGNWTERKDVRNVRVMSSGTNKMKQINNEWMTIKGKTIGPEIGIGHHLGNVTDAPVLILKSCIGNRSLGWDLLPPGSKEYEFEISIPATKVLQVNGPREQLPNQLAGMPASSTMAILIISKLSLKICRSTTRVPKNTKSPASSGGRETKTLETKLMLRSMRKTLSI